MSSKQLLFALVFLLLTQTIFAQPANNTCAGAITLTSGYTCTNTSGTVFGATNSGATNTCGGTVRYDVWYKFVAQSANPTITLSSVGANFPDARVQLFSGTCALLSAIGCQLTSYTATGLTVGNTYFIRVLTTTASTPTSASTFNICVTDPYLQSSRMKEVFKMTMLSGSNVLNDPWEVAYGPDGFLWVNEAKGYKVHRVEPNTGAKTTVLDISQGASGYLTSAQHTAFNVQFASNQSPWPQGGFAGLAVHPQFMATSNPKNYVYVSYVHRYDGVAAGTNNGTFFTSRVVRFTYNTGTSKLESPVSLVDTLPGSNDHNSQRLIIAPVNGVDYLFYACGDMGAGQFSNANRAIKSQINASYEGKILRFNLEEDGDADTFDRWIPNSNPYNGAAQTAVWSTGMRNNQGFAYMNLNGTDMLYGASHGAFSDDEINIIKSSKNYGHPLIIGYADGNYNGVKAGSASGSLPLIVSESANATTIGASYENPIYSGYAASNATVTSIYNNQTNNGAWPSEGWSGLDIYTHTRIPGWKNSLIVSSLKWGRVLRLKLSADGTSTVAMDGSDSLSYFGSSNRYRDVAISPDGRDIFVIMDKSSTTSGPSANNPAVPACAGCLQKYTFLGYTNTGTNRSNIPTSIPIAAGNNNSCATSTTVVINTDNNNLWVPITGPDGNIVAEIKANGNNLDTVITSFYYNSGALREDGYRRLLLDRNISITPKVQPSTPVSIRLYITNAEFASIVGANNSVGQTSGVSTINNIRMLKNNDGCGASLSSTTTAITPTYAEAHGTGGYVMHANITSFSSFYFT
ncbi:MAG: PQQ-dependent sugar dehydrogenase, partial [Flavisolibacter sp.]|nr:PQQ-dependent sugar dehydrogenase [Flavisolibacter sp.]